MDKSADSQSLRYRRANSRSDELGQVFTPEPIARLLTSALPKTCRHLLDLGAGRGALGVAASAQLKLDSLLMIERDRKHAEALTTEGLAWADVVLGDVLNSDWEGRWSAEPRTSCVVSNPPYGMLPLDQFQIETFCSSELRPPMQGSWIRGDAAFLSRAWALTSTGSAFAFIVTAPIISSGEFSFLRQKLVRELQDLTVTQLDERTFPGVEVRAYLINGVRGPHRRRRVLLKKADVSGKIIDELSVSHDDALVRLDIDFYRACERLRLLRRNELTTLADVGTQIIRGSLSNNEFAKLGIGAFHTTDFARNGEEIELSNAENHYRCATTGDILIPRVGSRCLTRHARVVHGVGPYTDCVYRLRSPTGVREQIWNTIASNFGREWREANASGNCARHLTQSTLLSMPLL